MNDGEIGPITKIAIEVYVQTEGWSPSELRQEIVRLRVAIDEKEQEQ